MKKFRLGRGSWLLSAALVSAGCGGVDPPSAVPPELHLDAELLVVPGSDTAEADGSAAHPFASIFDAIDAIAKVADWDGTIVLSAGKHAIERELVIPKNAYLKIEAGSTIAGGPGVSIHAQRDVQAVGTAEEPIVFTWLQEGSHWGSLTNFEPSSRHNVFQYVTFEHGYESDFNGIGMRGALSLNEASARISHCTFQNNEGDDGLNIKASDTLVEYSLFKDNATDGIDSDGVGSPEVAFCVFDGNGNDNLDLGEGTKMHVHHNLLINAGDKGISNGDGCTPLIENNLIVNGGLGIGIKDDAAPTIRNNTVYGNQFGIRVYHHVDGFGGGKGTVVNNIVWGSAEDDLLYDEGSTQFAYNCIGNLLDLDGNDIVDNEGNRIIDGPGMLTRGAGCDDPMFADPLNLDFHLTSAAGRFEEATEVWVEDDATSPCIDAADPAMDIGDEPAPNGARRNLGYEGGTAEASKSP